MRDHLLPYPGDSAKLSRFRSDYRPFFSVESDPPLAVVLGCGTPLTPDVNEEACAADGVPILRRKGGGGAVVLGPGCLVVSGCLPPVEGRFPDVWSRLISELFREALTGVGVEGVVIRGLGDLCFAGSSTGPERKFVGSSLYVARDVVLYQASLLRTMDLDLVTRYLGPPSREPEYRAGRAHRDFIANLPNGKGLDAKALESRLQQGMSELGF